MSQWAPQSARGGCHEPWWAYKCCLFGIPWVYGWDQSDFSI